MNKITIQRSMAIFLGLAVASLPGLVQADILIDFGGVAKRHSVGVADGNGNFWDYITGSTDNNTGLTDTTGVATGVGLAMSNFTGGGPGDYNSGLTPSGSLGDLAFTDVTDDAIFFPDSSTPTMTLSGLNPLEQYTLTFYGARETTISRVTTFAVGASNVALITSGTDIASNGTDDWNDDTVMTLSGLVPNGSTEIVVNLSATGGFGYVNALEITSTVVPEPASLMLILIGAGVVAGLRRRLYKQAL